MVHSGLSLDALRAGLAFTVADSGTRVKPWAFASDTNFYERATASEVKISPVFVVVAGS